MLKTAFIPRGTWGARGKALAGEDRQLRQGTGKALQAQAELAERGGGTSLPAPIVERRLAYASVNQAACACRFLFGTVLKRPLERFDIPMAKVPQTLPRILSREEVSRLFEHAANLRARALLMTTYAAGLRVSEVCALQLADIESAPDRMCIKVRHGKGGRDRYTMLSPALRVASVEWLRCPHCGEGRFAVVAAIPPTGRSPPLRGPP